MKVNYKVVFNIKKKLNKQNEAPIYIRVTIDRQAYYYNTNFYIPEKDWNDNKSEVRTTNKNYFQINHSINETILKMQKEEIDLRAKNKKITFDLLKRQFTIIDSIENSFIDFYRKEVELRNDVEPETITSHKNTLHKLISFRSEVLFSDLTFELIQNFEYYLISQKLKTNTRYKQHKHLKKYINLAIKKKLFSMDKNPYNDFKVSKEPTKRDALTKEEIIKLETVVFEPELQYLNKYRDLYLFSCFSGLRFSDVMRLSKKDLNIEEKGITINNFKMQKTGRFVTLPLYSLFEGKPEKIIKKYLALQKNDLDSQSNIFPKVTDQTTNEKLKDIAKLAGINKHLTFHTARHSFGTLVIEYGVDVMLVKELMGHSKLDTTLIYRNMGKERIDKLLQNINWNDAKTQKNRD